MNQKHSKSRASSGFFCSLYPRGLALMIICFIIATLWGCATCKEKLKIVVDGHEQRFSYPLRQVVLVSAEGLEDLGFTLTRMELLAQEGLIQAKVKGSEATLKFHAYFSDSVRIQAKVVEHSVLRNFAAEEAVLKNVEGLLALDVRPALKEVTAEMIPVYSASDPASLVIAYLAPGVEVSVTDNRGQWSMVSLTSGGSGYVQTRNLQLVLKEKKQG